MLEKRYDHLLVEANKYEKWKKAGYFACGDISKKPFSIVIPPPNVTGKLHLGHAWDMDEQTCRELHLEERYMAWCGMRGTGQGRQRQ